MMLMSEMDKFIKTFLVLFKFNEEPVILDPFLNTHLLMSRWPDFLVKIRYIKESLKINGNFHEKKSRRALKNPGQSGRITSKWPAYLRVVDVVKSSTGIYFWIFPIYFEFFKLLYQYSAEIVPHPGFILSSMINDIGLIRLGGVGSVSFSTFIMPIFFEATRWDSPATSVVRLKNKLQVK